MVLYKDGRNQEIREQDSYSITDQKEKVRGSVEERTFLENIDVEKG